MAHALCQPRITFLGYIISCGIVFFFKRRLEYLVIYFGIGCYSTDNPPVHKSLHNETLSLAHIFEYNEKDTRVKTETSQQHNHTGKVI